MPERDRQRLLGRIQRRFGTVARRVKVGRLELDFTRIADPDRVLDEVAAEDDRREKRRGRRLVEDELHLPYWAELWDSSQGVGQFLARGGAGDLREKSVLDLGCGMGLAGTVAAALGARVLFADLESPALLFAALNSWPWRERVRLRRVNWRTDDLGEKFALIIGADILYERAQWPFEESFWRRHLEPGGRVLLGEPGRQTGDAFPEWIEQRGWVMERLEEKVETRERPVRVFRLRHEGT
jgi:predicted nicotinamide N-methyase